MSRRPPTRQAHAAAGRVLPDPRPGPRPGRRSSWPPGPRTPLRSRAAVAVAALLVFAGAGIASGQTDDGSGPSVAAAVAWPVSMGLLVSEVQTGGASASDEFVELYNAGASAADLGGLELVYVSSSGASITRKAAWASPALVGPGAHLLVANAAGVHSPAADATYTGGLAATGGAVVLRPAGGTPIDAVAWGDAANAFVEGAAAIAPAAGSSIERLPGGPAGNGVDTNVNRDDLVARAVPGPQNLASPPVVGPAPTEPPVTHPPATDPPAETPTPTGTPPPAEPPTPTGTPPWTDPPEPSDPPRTEPPAQTPDPTQAPTPAPSPSDCPGTQLQAPAPSLRGRDTDSTTTRFLHPG